MKTPIRAGLIEKSSLRQLVEGGLQAIAGDHRALIEMDTREAFADSLDIDAAFRKGNEQENRWDYLLGHGPSRKIVGLEPHSANNKEVSTVIKKREAAVRHLRPHLKAGVFVAEWFWVASGNVDFVPLEKATTRLDQNGIRFVGRKLLRKWLADEGKHGAVKTANRKRKQPKAR